MDLTSPIPWSIFMLAPQTNEPKGTILDILSQLARLTRAQADLNQATQEEKRDFEQRLTSMERHTAVYMEVALKAGSLSRDDLIREASCIAGSIYTKLQFRDAQTSDAEMQGLRDRLLYIFTHLETEIAEPHKLDTEGPFLLWIMFCGGILCVSAEQRAFFVPRMKSLTTQLSIENWQEVDGILRGYLWSSKIDSWTFRMLWHEVELVC
jgi:Fungal specific transcription factor domain